jgi:hypothetical protein
MKITEKVIQVKVQGNYIKIVLMMERETVNKILDLVSIVPE